MTHVTGFNSPPDSPVRIEEDVEEDELHTVPKPKPRLSRQAALLTGQDTEDQKKHSSPNRRPKSAPGSEKTLSKLSENDAPESDEVDGVKGEVAYQDDGKEKEEEKKEESREKSIKSKMKSFLSNSSFSKGRKKSRQQSIDMNPKTTAKLCTKQFSENDDGSEESSSVMDGKEVKVGKERLSRGEQWKEKTKSFTSKLHVPRGTFRAKSVEEGETKGSEGKRRERKRSEREGSEVSENDPPKATSLTSVSGTQEVSPVRSPKKIITKHLLTPEVTVSSEDQEEGSGSFEKSYIFGIHIHSTDRKLKCSKLVVHPVIKVHVIDSLTGKYLKKLHPERNVVSYYENKHSDLDGIDYIMPLMTQPCDLLKHVRFPRAPVWEELLLYNEDFDHFLHNKVILFFEILDFISLDSLDMKKPRNQWWHRISWAFLRLVGADGRLNTEKKLRLQLFKANSLKISTEYSENQTTELFTWWSSGQRNAISGSLFVSVKAIPISQSQFKGVKASLRSLLPFQQEAGSSALSRIHQLNESTESANQSNATDQAQNIGNQVPNILLPRIHGLPSQVPKILWKDFSAGNNKSCYSVKFSRDGQRLACGASVFAAYLSAEKRSSIFIYELPSGRFDRRVNGFHLGTIYDIDWSVNDRLIMSASNDCTAQIWPVKKEKGTSVILPHPCFIYSCRFCPHPSSQYLIFTGAFDGFIRLWSVAKCFDSSSSHSPHSKDPDLLRQLDGHQGHVLSLDFKQVQLSPNETELILFSSGSTGIIILWKCPESEEKNLPVWDLCDWEVVKKIRIPDLKNVPINCIKVSPSGTKLFLCCRDGRLRMIDYDLEIVVQRYPGTFNFSHLIRGAMSPCGKFIFMGTEEGLVHVWKSDSGERIHSYEDLPFKGPVTCVEYHPYEDILAMCGLGGRTVSVCLFRHSDLDELDRKEDTKKKNQSTNSGLLLNVPDTHSRNPLSKSRTIDHSTNGEGSRNVLNKAIRRAEVAIKMKSLG